MLPECCVYGKIESVPLLVYMCLVHVLSHVGDEQINDLLRDVMDPIWIYALTDVDRRFCDEWFDRRIET